MAIAAQDFILAMEKTYGPGIFKAILEGHDERYVADLAGFKEKGAMMGGQDFVYPPRGPPGKYGYGVGSGQGAVAGGLNPQHQPTDLMMTRAPWAK